VILTVKGVDMKEIRTLREAVDYLNSLSESIGGLGPLWKIADQNSEEASGAIMIPRKRAFTMNGGM
jgi:hypothetical protein